MVLRSRRNVHEVVDFLTLNIESGSTARERIGSSPIVGANKIRV
jgi:hypothetical protein